jgi:hypothetical protein
MKPSKAEDDPDTLSEAVFAHLPSPESGSRFSQKWEISSQVHLCAAFTRDGVGANGRVFLSLIGSKSGQKSIFEKSLEKLSSISTGCNLALRHLISASDARRPTEASLTAANLETKMIRFISTAVTCFAITCFANGKADAQRYRLPTNPLPNFRSQSRNHIVMSPIKVIGTRPTKGRSADFPNTDGWPKPGDGEKLAKKLSDIVNGKNTSRAKPQTPIQMEPIVVVGQRPQKHSSEASRFQTNSRITSGPRRRPAASTFQAPMTHRFRK